MSIAALTASGSAMADQQDACPDTFYALPLFPDASLCQVFDGELPATLTYHAKADLQKTRDYYIAQLGKPEQEELKKGRIVLQYGASGKVLILSPDGSGSQVDILVKDAS